MRNWLSYCITILFVSIAACIAFWFYQPLIDTPAIHLFLPIPVNFALPKNNQVATLDVWSVPLHIANTEDSHAPSISAESSLVFDVTSGKVLFAKDVMTRLPLASLTKIMTAIIALEHPNKDDVYTLPDAALVGEDSIGLTSGESLSMSDLLYGLMLHSGNE